MEDPVIILIRILSSLYIPYLKLRPGVKVGKRLILKGIPIIEILGTGKIEIGDNVTLYSTKRQYFAHFSSPVRLFIEGASCISIGDNTRINGATIHARKKISIGKNCLVAANTSIIDSNGHNLCLENPDKRITSIDEPEEIFIEDSVWIGVNCVILKGVKIGYGSVIGAGSIVSNDIPPNSVAMGNPAQIKTKL